MNHLSQLYKDYQKDLESLGGVELLRSAIEFFNARPEYLNEGKSPIQLLNEYAKEMHLETLIERYT